MSSVSNSLDKREGDPEILLPQVLELIEDFRFLAADEKYNALLKVLSTKQDDCFMEIKKSLDYHREKIDTMIDRAKESRQALADIDSSMVTSDEQNSTLNKKPWILGAHLFDIYTYYRVDETDNSLEIKLEGTSTDLPIFEQAAVAHEVDLFKLWVPFCAESLRIAKLGKADLIPYVYLSASGIISRDFALRVYGSDCLQEHSAMVLVGKSIEDYTPPEGVAKIPIPFKEIGWLHNRMIIKDLKIIVSLINAESAKTTIIAQVDPRAALPQWLLNFIIKNFASVILYLFQRQARKLLDDPESIYWQRVRDNNEFYRDWVLPKFRKLCALKGWKQATIAALGADGIPPPDSPESVESQPGPVSDPPSSEPPSSEPTSSEPTSSEPTSSEPTSSEPTSSEPTSSEPVPYPVSSEPFSAESASSVPASLEPVSAEFSTETDGNVIEPKDNVNSLTVSTAISEENLNILNTRV